MIFSIVHLNFHQLKNRKNPVWYLNYKSRQKNPSLIHFAVNWFLQKRNADYENKYLSQTFTLGLFYVAGAQRAKLNTPKGL